MRARGRGVSCKWGVLHLFWLGAFARGGNPGVDDRTLLHPGGFSSRPEPLALRALLA